jgi:hypothetical protein
MGFKEDKKWEEHRNFLLPKSPPTPPLVSPSYAPLEIVGTIAPATQSPIYRLPTTANTDDGRWSGSSYGKGGKGKGGPGNGNELPRPPPPEMDDANSNDDNSSGKGKGGGPIVPLPPPDGKGKGALPLPPQGGKGKGGKGKGGKGSKEPKLPKKKEDKSSKSKSQKGKMSKISKCKSAKTMSKGKGKGKGIWTHAPSKPSPPTPNKPTKPTASPSPPPASGPCLSSFSSFVLESVPESTAKNPNRCCAFDGATAAIVTHAQPDNSTESGFEPFWNNMYLVIDAASKKSGVCFFMTGYNPNVKTGRNLSEVLINVNQVVSGIQMVPSMMSTDPTSGDALVTEIRRISSNPAQPSIGVFNSGYDNIQLEKLVSGLPAIPFVGYMNENAYGQEAALASRQLLGSEPPIPACFNARTDVSLVGARCQAYYSALQVEVEPVTGFNCSSVTAPQQIVEILLARSVNVAWSHSDCCAAVAQAAASVLPMGRKVIVGCMDDVPTTNGTSMVDFVTRQPETLQAYATSSWANFPVIQQVRGRDGRQEQFFPSLSSLVHTAIFNEILN